MRILICDDDLLIVEKLQKYLKSYFSHLHLSCPEIVCFSDGESLLADPGDKDILFLDIEMPEHPRLQKYWMMLRQSVISTLPEQL